MRSEPISAEAPWWGTESHRATLLADAKHQFAFFLPGLDPAGGFHSLDEEGMPIPGAPRSLLQTASTVHAYAMAHLMGAKGADDMVDHGMRTLWKMHRDPDHGGYAWAFAPGGEIADPRKFALGHAFVLLAAAGAREAGHPDADRLLEDVWDVINFHFWDHNYTRMREEYAGDWQVLSQYRSLSANLHAAEAFLAAGEATGDPAFKARARVILDFFAGRAAQNNGWRVPEHYTREWEADPGFEGDPMFRPAGTEPGHALELSRLLLQAWDLDGRRDHKLSDWAGKLYAQAVADGWDQDKGGFFHTIDEEGLPLRRNRYWWPLAEAIAAAAARLKISEDEKTLAEYRMFWRAAERLFIDREKGGWLPEARPEPGEASEERPLFTGKPGLWHSAEAALFPLLPGLSHPMQDIAGLSLY